MRKSLACRDWLTRGKLIKQWMSHKFGVHVMPAEIILLEGKNARDLVHPAPQLFHSPWSPRPKLRGDILQSWNAAVVGVKAPAIVFATYGGNVFVGNLMVLVKKDSKGNFTATTIKP